MAARRLVLLVALALVPAGPAAGAEPAKLPPERYPAVVQQERLIAMDDGVRLAATLHFPSHDGKAPAGGRFPVVLSMTPYGRTTPSGGNGMEQTLALRGIVAAVVDIRGAGGSGGTLADNYFSPRESRDGKLVVDWLGTQPWSSGKVAMTGGSYIGITQYLTAALQPEHLVAITPNVALADLYRDAWTHGGIPNGFFGAQYLAVQGVPGAVGANNDPALLEATIQHKAGQRPPGTIAFDFLANPDDGPFYRERSPIVVAERIQVPVLILSGWRDGLLRGAPEMFQVLSRRDGVTTRMSIGPCSHKGCGAPFAALNNPPGVDSVRAHVFEFLDHHLTGAPLPERPAVRLYVQGANRYLDSDRWPPRGSRTQRLYLSPDGSLVPRPPRRPAEQTYATNPADGFSMALDRHGTVAISPYVPVDQRAETGRGLTWRTPPLESPLTLAGPAALRLVARSSATDTDWHVKLSDVAPDGTETIITDGALRASHRALDRSRSTPTRPYHRHTDPRPLKPGRTYGFEIEIWPTAHQLAAGHRLQVRLTSSNLPTHFPARFDLDPAAPGPDAVRPLAPAVNTVRTGGVKAAGLALTVIDAP